MAEIITEAWILNSGYGNTEPGLLMREEMNLGVLLPDEVLIHPIYGCWEGNMHHAIMRDPVDICMQRKEDKIVLGNAGVVKVIDTGKNVKDLKPGDVCMLFCNAISDKYGYPEKILAYDAPNTYGLLSRQSKVSRHTLIPIPPHSGFSLKQWAAFSLRYVTAWANWKVALKCWQSQMGDVPVENEFVISWGGGVCLAELELAKNYGFNVAMITSLNERKESLEQAGIITVDRRGFPHLHYDQERYTNDEAYKKNYRTSEKLFLEKINEITGGAGAAIFIDNIGLSVYRATLKALSRQGVIATSGWKWGMELSHLRAIESINRHIHVHTHYAKHTEAIEAMEYALRNNWMPQVDVDYVYEWDEIPRLCSDYATGNLISYFPLYKINDE
ncbi:MDR/zinc-dependent alcohol dehydrogenase-like family protein [Chitinophaga flava]|uniref:Zinc-binding dehydrogenase n=1 Tax=Chitinophaga flava TaxID=2259036 RepID=A0A365XWK8_9BACT|nr:zinc-binding alcohol dehydrogenase family protein [Chitinophaga flava]RBL90381.1 zinc-binding dehydrogenase [Chitinophaga flava]